MFKRRALRVVAGMLFGAAAGILWGAWYNASKAEALVRNDELAQMNALLSSIMLGSAAGFVIGMVVGLARNSMATGMMAGLVGAVTAMILRPGFPFVAASDMSSAVIAAAGLILLFVGVSALAIPPGRSAQSG